MTNENTPEYIELKSKAYRAELYLGEGDESYTRFGVLYVDEFSHGFGYRFISKPFAGAAQIVTSEQNFYKTEEDAFESVFSKGVNLRKSYDKDNPETEKPDSA